LGTTGLVGAGGPAGKDKLGLRAAQAFRERIGGPLPPFRLILDKARPVAAGLGGGSSDAGAVLRLLRDLLAPSMPDGDLEGLAAALGADGAACLWGRPVLAEGRGERLLPAPALPPLDAVLVNPLIPSPTGAVYRAYDAAVHPDGASRPAMFDDLESPEEVCAWLAAFTRNDLQAPAIALEPRIGEVIDLLNNVSRARAPSLLAELMDRLDANGRYALLKLATGGMRVGIPARLAKTAFAQGFDLSGGEVEEVWHGLRPPYAELFDWAERRPQPPTQGSGNRA